MYNSPKCVFAIFYFILSFFYFYVFFFSFFVFFLIFFSWREWIQRKFLILYNILKACIINIIATYQVGVQASSFFFFLFLLIRWIVINILLFLRKWKKIKVIYWLYSMMLVHPSNICIYVYIWYIHISLLCVPNMQTKIQIRKNHQSYTCTLTDWCRQT